MRSNKYDSIVKSREILMKNLKQNRDNNFKLETEFYKQAHRKFKIPLRPSEFIRNQNF